MTTLGLDIGGAHLKAAHSDGACICKPFALWLAPEQLTGELEKLIKTLPKFDRMAVTMTAELCDCFETKRQGVEHIFTSVEMVAAGLGLKPDAVKAWTTQGTLIDLAEARTRPLLCAASNWHALATWVAGQHPIGVTILIDCGSTTTDIIKLTGGQVQAKALTDTQRLQSSELVYIGAMRTPLAALGPTIDFNGKPYPLMNEYFATSADVFVLTGGIPEQPDNTNTCDGKPLTKAHAVVRIVRMIGADTDMLTPDEAVELARSFANVIYRRIAESITKVIAVPHAPKTSRFCICGSGSFIARQAIRLMDDRTDILPLINQIGAEASVCACAYALTRLCDAT